MSWSLQWADFVKLTLITRIFQDKHRAKNFVYKLEINFERSAVPKSMFEFGIVRFLVCPLTQYKTREIPLLRKTFCFAVCRSISHLLGHQHHVFFSQWTRTSLLHWNREVYSLSMIPWQLQLSLFINRSSGDWKLRVRHAVPNDNRLNIDWGRLFQASCQLFARKKHSMCRFRKCIAKLVKKVVLKEDEKHVLLDCRKKTIMTATIIANQVLFACKFVVWMFTTQILFLLYFEEICLPSFFLSRNGCWLRSPKGS